MLSIEQAIDCVAATVRRPAGPSEQVPLADAVGRLLAADVRTDVDLPPFSRSTMDGFAVRCVDAASPGAVLRVVDESAAGRPAARAVGEGEAIRIFTGAVLPADADAVLQVERTAPVDGADDRVRLEAAVRPGQNVARGGEDLRRGEVAVPAGARLGVGHVNLLASVGATSLPVVPRPRVAVLATGTELVPPDRVPTGGQIRESNGAMLAALVRRAGASVAWVETVADDRDRIAALAGRGLEADVLLLSGGSSVGDYDFTPDVLAAHGVTTHFDRVALKPGKPTLFGTLGERVVFGLPGNPISAFVAFHLFVRPALLRRAGLDDVRPTRFRARLDDAVPRLAARDQVLPARLRLDDGRWHVAFSGWHGSGDVTCLRDADALLPIPKGDGALAAGEETWVLPLDGGRLGSSALSLS
ncbi:MAG: gephyrin-like molybdotransferase Glp [Planctomycetota bacterium JB042]